MIFLFSLDQYSLIMSNHTMLIAPRTTKGGSLGCSTAADEPRELRLTWTGGPGNQEEPYCVTPHGLAKRDGRGTHYKFDFQAKNMYIYLK